MLERWQENKNKYMKHARDFKRYFGKDLRPYFDYIFGFDIINFSQDIWPEVYTQDGSIQDFIIENYGNAASELITSLLA